MRVLESDAIHALAIICLPPEDLSTISYDDDSVLLLRFDDALSIIFFVDIVRSVVANGLCIHYKCVFARVGCNPCVGTVACRLKISISISLHFRTMMMILSCSFVSTTRSL